MGFGFAPTVGLSVGLCWIWNTSLISHASLLYGTRWISLPFEWVSTNVWLILVYGHNNANDSALLWEKLKTLVDFDGIVIVMGDFN